MKKYLIMENWQSSQNLQYVKKKASLQLRSSNNIFHKFHDILAFFVKSYTF